MAKGTWKSAGRDSPIFNGRFVISTFRRREKLDETMNPNNPEESENEGNFEISGQRQSNIQRQIRGIRKKA